MRELHQADTADADADEGDARTALTHDEGTPLLGNTSCDEQGRTIANGDGQVTYKREIWGFIGYMIPIFGNQVLWKYFSVLGPVTQMGKHGTLALAGAALANSTIALIVVVPVNAASAALDTLSTQAHGGRKYSTIQNLNRLYSLRVYLVMWIMITVLLPMSCLFAPIFRLMHVQVEIAHIAANFMQHAAFGIPAFFTYECIRKYCQAQGRMIGPAVTIALAAIPTLPLLFSDTFGLYTPAVSRGCFWTATAVFGGLYLYFCLPKSTFEDLPNLKIVSQDLGIVIRLTLAGLIAIGADYFAWEFLNVASTWISSEVLAANSVLLATVNMFSSLPSALTNASATRVGNYLGSNQPLNAKKAAYTSLVMPCVTAAFTATVLAFNEKSWSALFTSDPVIVQLLQEIMPFFCFISFVDGLQGVCQGILRGAGRPDCPYPLYSLLVLVKGLFGLWLGFGAGLSLASARLFYLIICNDWNASAREAQARLRASELRSAAA